MGSLNIFWNRLSIFVLVAAVGKRMKRGSLCAARKRGSEISPVAAIAASASLTKSFSHGARACVEGTAAAATAADSRQISRLDPRLHQEVSVSQAVASL